MSDDRIDITKIFVVCMSMNARLDLLWQRMIYSHAAIIGVMVFFSTTPEPYVVARLLVFLVYSINLFVSLAALSESYQGLEAALQDIRETEHTDGIEHLHGWLSGRDYTRHSGRRIAVFVPIWLLVGYLLFARFLVA